MHTQKIEYHEDGVSMEGWLAYDSKIQGPRPAVLVVHDWSGCNEFARHKAEKLAELGYVGFAVDMFGQGKIGKTKEEKTALIQPLVNHPKKLHARIRKAFEIIQQQDNVDRKKIGAIGFCFGGLCALELARSGCDVKGVVSFHGLLNSLPQEKTHPIKAKILVLHGFDDPMVPPEDALNFAREMTEAHVDWQLQVYGNTMHAFTNPEAHDPGFGTVYDAKADARSWVAMREFFGEIFS